METLWTVDEDHTLLHAVARNIHSQPFPWRNVADEFPQKSQTEVLKRISHYLQDIQKEILTQAVQHSETQLQNFLIKQQQQPQKSETTMEEERIRKKRSGPVPWSEEDHKNFLRGIRAHNWGNWKTIQKRFLPNKSVSQITSHGQKFLKKKNSNKEKKRKSIHDVTLDDNDGSDCRVSMLMASSRRDKLVELRIC